MTKVTHKDYYNDIIALAVENGRQDIADFAQGRIDAIEKKNANRKPSKAEAENEVLRAEVKAVLTSEGATVSDIMGRSATLSALSNQKVAALLRQMCNAGTAVRATEGKKALFSLA